MLSECPTGYKLVDGDIPGWGWKSTHNVETIDDCATLCSDHVECCSYEWSPTAHICNLNKVCQPTEDKYRDYFFCQREDMGNFALLWIVLGFCSRGSFLVFSMPHWLYAVQRRQSDRKWIVYQKLFKHTYK